MSGTNNSSTAPGHPPVRRFWAPWAHLARFWVLQAGLVLATVLVTQFLATSPADAARAAALAVWAQDDPARLQAMQRYAACMRDGVPGVHGTQGCARHAGGAVLGDAMVDVTEIAMQRAMEHIPAPLAWFVQ
jgi:hypothetical protein